MGQTDARSRKSSVAESSAALPTDRPNAAPTTFFLARASNHPRSNSSVSDTSALHTSPVGTLQDLIDESSPRSKQVAPAREGHQRSTSRRRSTIKPRSNERLPRESLTETSPKAHAVFDRSTTPSPLPSQHASLPSSPKSISSRSMPKSDDELTSDDAASQAIASSEDEREEAVPAVHDSQPELIMPSIKMPSRRPFTARGRRMPRFKILVAGEKGRSRHSL